MFSTTHQPIVQMRFAVIIAALSMLFTTLAYGIITPVQAKSEAAKPAIITPTVSQKSTKITQSTETAATPQVAATEKPSTAPAPQAPMCIKSHLIAPSEINLAGQPAGLTIIAEPIHYYTVYGNSPSEIARQVNQCSPVAYINGSAVSYSQLSLAYDLTQNGETCSVANAKVGLHNIIMQLSLGNYDTANTSTRASFDRYSQAITVHEAGHLAIDKQYAARMLAELQSSSGNCATIGSEIQTLMISIRNQLNAANASCDTTTGYGRTQGVTL